MNDKVVLWPWGTSDSTLISSWKKKNIQKKKAFQVEDFDKVKH